MVMNNELKFTDDAVKLVDFIGEHMKSRTQSIKTLIVEKNGEKFLSVQKWWRKSADEPWQEGKGFHFSVEDAELIVNHIDKGLEKLQRIS